ncbi:MAG TPA: hypothetical protein VJR89_09240, partial [Polyangiales bacterium]|nr:hypothetical protein [Polyangiales bacterium]
MAATDHGSVAVAEAGAHAGEAGMPGIRSTEAGTSGSAAGAESARAGAGSPAVAGRESAGAGAAGEAVPPREPPSPRTTDEEGCPLTLVGFATIEGGTTGGGAAQPTRVSTQAELRACATAA